jgi:hypothetical protein
MFNIPGAVDRRSTSRAIPTIREKFSRSEGDGKRGEVMAQLPVVATVRTRFSSRSGNKCPRCLGIGTASRRDCFRDGVDGHSSWRTLLRQFDAALECSKAVGVKGIEARFP